MLLDSVAGRGDFDKRLAEEILARRLTLSSAAPSPSPPGSSSSSSRDGDQPNVLPPPSDKAVYVPHVDAWRLRPGVDQAPNGFDTLGKAIMNHPLVQGAALDLFRFAADNDMAVNPLISGGWVQSPLFALEGSDDGED